VQKLKAVRHFYRAAKQTRSALQPKVAEWSERALFGGEWRERIVKSILLAHYQSRFRRQWKWQAYGAPHFTDTSYVLFRLFEGNFGEGVYHLTRAFLTGEAVTDGAVILDIGCGDGGFTKRFLAPKASHVDAIDIEPSAIEWASQHNAAPNITYLLSDAIREPFPRKGYDLIVFDGAIGHISKSDSDVLLRKIAESLSPEGLFVGSESLGPEGHDHLQCFDELESLRALLKPYFSVVRLKKTSYYINDGTYFRTEAYWRCAHNEEAAKGNHWT
jgi:2-polyprenyl-3-methyl-5-hydroxy-6-metoxy-1,4-benzoquinol methylase